MTIELIEKRKAELQAQQSQFVANANAINGAIQDCDYWISQLKAVPVSEVPSAPAA